MKTKTDSVQFLLMLVNDKIKTEINQNIDANGIRFERQGCQNVISYDAYVSC